MGLTFTCEVLKSPVGLRMEMRLGLKHLFNHRLWQKDDKRFRVKGRLCKGSNIFPWDAGALHTPCCRGGIIQVPAHFPASLLAVEGE